MSNLVPSCHLPTLPLTRICVSIALSNVSLAQGDFYRSKAETDVPPPSGWSTDCGAPNAPAPCPGGKAPAPASVQPLPPDSEYFTPQQPSTLIGRADTAFCANSWGSGAAPWWLRRVAWPGLLGTRGSLDLAAECTALWVTAPAAMISHLTLASSREALHASTIHSGAGHRRRHTGNRATAGNAHPALDISSGSAATIAHCTIVGGVHVRGPRTMPLLEWLDFAFATTGLRISNHAAPTVLDARMRTSQIQVGVDVTRLSQPILRRLTISDVRFSGVIFSQAARGRLDWSTIEKPGLVAVAFASGATPALSRSVIEHAGQDGILVEGVNTAGSVWRVDVFRSSFAGIELRHHAKHSGGGYCSRVRGGCVTVTESTIREAQSSGLYAHSGGAAQLVDVALTGNALGARVSVSV